MNKTSQPLSSRLILVSVLLIALAFLLAPAGQTAYTSATENNSAFSPELVTAYHGSAAVSNRTSAVASKGIYEEVPAKYKARYAQWKKEFLATEIGRQQWASYQNNPDFTLRIVVTRDNPEGGTTGSYQWNDDGKLVAATITLGARLDAGVPDPVYFPVMNSLLPTETTRSVDGATLAATKLAHEFGHVNRTVKGDTQLYQLQSRLMPQYNQIFLNNGRDANDPRLIDLAKRMGGTPVEIWEDREYWGETNAMLFLRDRFAEDGFRCLLFSRIKRSVDLYAPGYEERFSVVAQSTQSARNCGWQ